MPSYLSMIMTLDNQDLLAQQNSDPTIGREPILILRLKHFIILLIASMGLYGMWWMFKAWRFFRERDNLDILPAARALFGIIFFYSLGEKIKGFAKQKGYTFGYSSILLAAGYILGNLLGRLPDPFWIISVTSGLLLIQPFNAFNFGLKHSLELTIVEQKFFNGRQITTLLIGITCWILVILGLWSEYN